MAPHLVKNKFQHGVSPATIDREPLIMAPAVALADAWQTAAKAFPELETLIDEDSPVWLLQSP